LLSYLKLDEFLEFSVGTYAWEGLFGSYQ